MWNIPSKERLDRIPRLYSTESVSVAEKIVHLHFFLANSDWFVVEYDGADLFFGYTILCSDLNCAEWGYISFNELKSLKIGFLEVDCEREEFWGVKIVSDIEKIRKWEEPQ